MKLLLPVLLFLSPCIFAQQGYKEDKITEEHLRTSVNYLANDSLQGRRTGTPGEKLAYEFLVKEFKKAGLSFMRGTKTYLQPFDVYEGTEIGKETTLILNGQRKKLYTDFIPYPFSANVKNFIITDDNSDVAYYDTGAMEAANENDPHFDINEDIINFAKKAAADGMNLVIVKKTAPAIEVPRAGKFKKERLQLKDTASAEKKNDLRKKSLNLTFNGRDKTPVLTIPVICLVIRPADAQVQGISTEKNNTSSLTVSLIPKNRTGHNVIGYINNKAKNTIILGAHYDHLGLGEDHNSLYAGTAPMIHNGADDNASGTAALIELGKWLKKSNYKEYNYLLIAFSGEELGLFGSKYFTEHPGLDLKTVNYMINMDMIGRLNDSTHGLTIGGYGTSPSWGKLIDLKDPYFKINADSSGIGPSDHTSFYKKDIPVLFFFTGSHKDYHKPSDDADKINYKGELQVIHYIQNILIQTDNTEKLVFAKTRDASAGKNSFKVSLGIMPDYTFSGNGVRVDGVSDSRAAQKAGIQIGDVLVQLGEHKFSDVQSYMEALNKFNKGESTKVKLMRGKDELILPVTF